MENNDFRATGLALAIMSALPDNAASSAAAAAASAAEAKAVQESIPEDYTTLSNDVDDLKSAVDNAEDDIADLKIDVPGKVNKPTSSPNGTSGQLLRTNGDGTTTWVDQGLPTDAQTATAVSAWLTAHPEATTTVQDGSLTVAKMSTDMQRKVMNDYITPDMFDAVGDGVTDDTAHLRDAVYYSHANGVELHFPSGKKYLVSSNLNNHNNADYDCTVNITGNNPTHFGEYSLGNRGGIKLADGAELFANKEIKGSIRNLSVCGATRDTDTSIFKNCSAYNLTIFGCNMSQIGAIFRDTGLSHTTIIDSNTFLTAYYFAKNENKTAEMTDATISNNYINGGAELNDNAFSEFASYNGSIIHDNFIDYYQCMYRPKRMTLGSCLGLVSINNNYQVFRYFSWFDKSANNVNTSYVYSDGDVFNWMKESTLSKLQSFTKYTYTDKDSQTQTIPPYIFGYFREYDSIIIRNAIIQNNIDKNELIAIRNASLNYEHATGEFSSNLNPLEIHTINLLSPLSGNYNTCYNWGNYKNNCFRIDAIPPVDTLPSFSTGWSKAFVGMKVLYNNVIYTATMYYDGSAWQAKWLDQFGNSPA